MIGWKICMQDFLRTVVWWWCNGDKVDVQGFICNCNLKLINLLLLMIGELICLSKRKTSVAIWLLWQKFLKNSNQYSEKTIFLYREKEKKSNSPLTWGVVFFLDWFFAFSINFSRPGRLFVLMIFLVLISSSRLTSLLLDRTFLSSRGRRDSLLSSDFTKVDFSTFEIGFSNKSFESVILGGDKQIVAEIK